MINDDEADDDSDGSFCSEDEMDILDYFSD